MLFLALGAVDTRRSTRQRVLDELDTIQSSLNSLERAQCDTFVSDRSECMANLGDLGDGIDDCTDAFFVENCVAIQCVPSSVSWAMCFGSSSAHDCCAPKKAKKEIPCTGSAIAAAAVVYHGGCTTPPEMLVPPTAYEEGGRWISTDSPTLGRGAWRKDEWPAWKGFSQASDGSHAEMVPQDGSSELTAAGDFYTMNLHSCSAVISFYYDTSGDLKKVHMYHRGGSATNWAGTDAGRAELPSAIGATVDDWDGNAFVLFACGDLEYCREMVPELAENIGDDSRINVYPRELSAVHVHWSPDSAHSAGADAGAPDYAGRAMFFPVWK